MFETLPVYAKIIVVIVGLALVTVIVKMILSKAKFSNHRLQTVVTLINSLVQYVVFIVGMTWILSILGVDVNMIFASVGIVALIVGFSAESLIEDVITGLFMVFENQFNVGDVVEIDGYRGTVEKIGIRTICLRDSGDNLKIVNNSNIKNMVNLSMNISRAVCDIGVSYKEDLIELEKKIPNILNEIYEKHQDIFISEPKYIGVQDFQKTGLILRFTAEVDEKDIYSGRRILNREIYVAFVEQGTVMAHE